MSTTPSAARLPWRRGPRPGTVGSYRDSTMLINRSREDYLALGIIVLAIGGDIAAFYVVLARVFRGSTFLIVIGTVTYILRSLGGRIDVETDRRAERARSRRVTLTKLGRTRQFRYKSGKEAAK